jgi:hypothetical protein
MSAAAAIFRARQIQALFPESIIGTWLANTSNACKTKSKRGSCKRIGTMTGYSRLQNQFPYVI